MAAAAGWLVEGLLNLETLRLARCRLTTFPSLAAAHGATLCTLDLGANHLSEVSCLGNHPSDGHVLAVNTGCVQGMLATCHATCAQRHRQSRLRVSV